METVIKDENTINPSIDSSWKAVLDEEFNALYFKSLKSFLVMERSQYQVYPRGSDIFAAFNNTPFESTRVVILGQDPYHGPGQAHGLCFSVPDGVAKPPSLKNILKELEADLGIPEPANGNLTKWAQQGVLLLNTTLTVRANSPLSHQGKGWEVFTDAVIRNLSERLNSLVFILWGNPAGLKASFIDSNRHLILRAPHPSPLSAHRGFFGCKHFSKTNNYLSENDFKPIDWNPK